MVQDFVPPPIDPMLRILLASAVVVFAAYACAPDRPPKPNVVLIVVDTLRADHLGVYGYDKPTSPRLDALAREGVRFANARATSSWTLPSVASMLTSVYPAAHGAEVNTAALSPDVVTMPEAFRDAGYLTAAFSANPAFVTPLQGFAQGFDEFTVEHGRPSKTGRQQGDTTPSDPWMQSMVGVATAATITASALRWIAGHDHVPAPYFLYLHYFDPHAGYFPPPEYATRFGVPEDDPLRGEAQWPLLLSFKAPADARDTETLRKLYDAEIAFTDTQIGVLLDGIRARGARPTYVVFASDHGEEFDDHGGIQHGRTLFDELLRVPLIVAGPGIPAGGVVDVPVSLVSLWPTLAQLVGAASPAKADGTSLVDLIRGGGTRDRSPNLFADLGARFQNDALLHRRAVVSGRWKLIIEEDGTPLLFDVDTDARERMSVPHPGPRGMLQALLKRHDLAALQTRRTQPPEKIELTPERRERLKALGYLQ